MKRWSLALIALLLLAWSPAAMADCTTRTTPTALKTKCDDGSRYTIRRTGSNTRASGDEQGQAKQAALAAAYANPAWRPYPYQRYYYPGARIETPAEGLGYLTGQALSGNTPKTRIYIQN